MKINISPFIENKPLDPNMDGYVSYILYNISSDIPLYEFMKSSNNGFYYAFCDSRGYAFKDWKDVFEEMKWYFYNTVYHNILFFSLTKVKEVEFTLMNDDDPEDHVIVNIVPKYRIDKDGRNFSAELRITMTGSYSAKTTVKNK